MRLELVFAWTVIAWVASGCTSTKPLAMPVEDPPDAGTHLRDAAVSDAGDAHVQSPDATTSAADAAAEEPAGGSAAKQFAAAYERATRDHITGCCDMIGLSGPDAGWSFRLPPARSNVKFDAIAAKKCLEEVANLPCELEKEAHPTAPSCTAVFSHGDVALGEPCTSEFECAQDAGEITACNEQLIDKKLSYRCTRVVEAHAGDACLSDTTNDRFCPATLLCNEDTNRCEPRAKLGQPCLTGPVLGDTCEIGATCDRLSSHQCIKSTPIGKPCDQPDDCESLACRRGVCIKPLFVYTVCGP